MKTLILALGNPILSDDAVGWEVADRLSSRLRGHSVDVLKESAAGLDLLRTISEYERLIVVDAIQLGTRPVGSIHRFTLDELRSTIRYSSAHDINFVTAFAMGKTLGYEMPEDIRIYGIEVKELRVFAEGLTPEVGEKLDDIAGEIAADLGNPTS